jgi:hypothetical protein
VAVARVARPPPHRPERPQGTDPQLDELRAAGCDVVLEEHASGADRGHPVLARLLQEIRPDDTLVVVRLDRLPRSMTHLLAVIEQLEGRGRTSGLRAQLARDCRCHGLPARRTRCLEIPLG